MEEASKRAEELEELLRTTKSSSKNISMKRRLSEDDTDVYTYFHDLPEEKNWKAGRNTLGE